MREAGIQLPAAMSAQSSGRQQRRRTSGQMHSMDRVQSPAWRFLPALGARHAL